MRARFLGWRDDKGVKYTEEEIPYLGLPNWPLGKIFEVRATRNLRLPFEIDLDVGFTKLRANELEILPEKPFDERDWL